MGTLLCMRDMLPRLPIILAMGSVALLTIVVSILVTIGTSAVLIYVAKIIKEDDSKKKIGHN